MLHAEDVCVMDASALEADLDVRLNTKRTKRNMYIAILNTCLPAFIHATKCAAALLARSWQVRSDIDGPPWCIYVSGLLVCGAVRCSEILFAGLATSWKPTNLCIECERSLSAPRHAARDAMMLTGCSSAQLMYTSLHGPTARLLARGSTPVASRCTLCTTGSSNEDRRAPLSRRNRWRRTMRFGTTTLRGAAEMR